MECGNGPGNWKKLEKLDVVFVSGVLTLSVLPSPAGGSVGVCLGSMGRDANDTVVDKHFCTVEHRTWQLFSEQRLPDSMVSSAVRWVPSIGAWGDTVFAIISFCLLILRPFSLRSQSVAAVGTNGGMSRGSPVIDFMCNFLPLGLVLFLPRSGYAEYI